MPEHADCGSKRARVGFNFRQPLLPSDSGAICQRRETANDVTNGKARLVRGYHPNTTVQPYTDTPIGTGAAYEGSSLA